MRIVTLFLLVFLQAGISYGNDRELASEGSEVKLTISNAFTCGSTAKVTIKTRSAAYFDLGAEVIQKLADTSRAILGFECPEITNIEFTGITDGVMVFRADAGKSNNWVLESYPPPLEKLALFYSLYEPEFYYLPFLSSQIENYSHINGIKETYQYYAYEEQIKRLVSVIDGDTDRFSSYIEQSLQNFDTPEEAEVYYSAILQAIRTYTPQHFEAYTKKYNEIASSELTIETNDLSPRVDLEKKDNTVQSIPAANIDAPVISSMNNNTDITPPKPNQTVTDTSLLPRPGLDGRTTWRVMYNLSSKPCLAFLILENNDSGRFFGRIDTVSPETGAYQLSGEINNEGTITLKANGKIETARSTSRHNSQAFNLIGKLEADGLTLEGNVEGVKGTGHFEALKFLPDTRPPHPDGLFIREHKRNQAPAVSIETCRNLFSWISKQSNEQIDYQTKIPTQVYSQSFYVFFGKPYDQCALEERTVYNQLTIQCSNKLRNSGTVDDAKLLSEYRKNNNPLYNMMFLNGSSGYPIFPKNHRSYGSQPNYHDFAIYFHYVGLRDGKMLVEHRVRALENKTNLEKEDLQNIESLVAEITTKPSNNKPTLTRIAAADAGEHLDRLKVLRSKYDDQQRKLALEALAIVPGTRLSSNPDPKDKQDFIVHLLGVARACGGLPKGQAGREECMTLCNRLAEENKALDLGPDINLIKWIDCKDKQDVAFGISHENYPVKRNDYAWGYDDTDSYWYGGWVLDLNDEKVLLGHDQLKSNWYAKQDIRKFVGKGRVEVHKNGKYYPAIITGKDIMGNIVVRYTNSLPKNLKDLQAKPENKDFFIDLIENYTGTTYDKTERMNEMARTARKRMGLDDDMENISIKRVRRPSVGNSDNWPDLLAGILNTYEGNVVKVLSVAELIANDALSDDFIEFTDDYLSSWIRNELNYYRENLNTAPLYEIGQASKFIETFPDPSGIEVLGKVKTILQKSPDEFVTLIEQRITALETLAMDVIRDTGTRYDDTEAVFETGFALAEEFEEAGYVEQGQRLITATVEYIDQLLASNVELYKEELRQIEFTEDSYTALQEQMWIFEELSDQFEGFKAYQIAALETLKRGKQIICENALKEANIKQSDFDKKIYIGEKLVTLRDLACNLHERGHLVSEFSKKGLLGNYILGIEEGSGLINNFRLKSDKNGLEVVERSGDEEVPITATEWQDYITVLAYPPSGVPDAQGVRECDTLAADPNDPQKITDGVDFESEEIEPNFFDRAIEACMAAVEDNPNDERQQFQLGRLLWYAGDQETAAEYIGLSSDAGYAAALYYKAEILLATSDDNNSFVDALNFFEEAGHNGYERGHAMIKELSPEGLEFFKEIPPPTGKELVSALAHKVDRSLNTMGMKGSIKLVDIQVKSCFQTSPTDFSCEYRQVLDCNVAPTSNFWANDWRPGFASKVFQADCDSIQPEFGNFRKKQDGSWVKLADNS